MQSNRRYHLASPPRFLDVLKWTGLLLALVSTFYLFKIRVISVPATISIRLNISALDQFDPLLWDHIRVNHVQPPSTLEYGFDIGKKKLEIIDSELDPRLKELFKDKVGGFFVEVGAFDGVWSHTLIMEKERNWTGLLIECHPSLLPLLKDVHRRAFIVDLCLSRGKYPEKATLTSLDSHTGSSSLGSEKHLFPNIPSNISTFEVQTVPLFAIMAAINISQVDLFILDIQSLELDVLHNFPFDRILVKVWVVEVYFLDGSQRESLRRFMEGQGYSKDRFWALGMDFIFVHNSFPA